MNNPQVAPLALNPHVSRMACYASKAISLRARQNPEIADLSFGEPVFGPPAHLLQEIAEQDLTLSGFLDGAKRYEDPRGALELRQAIAAWYLARYGLALDPEREIMVTHGAVEAITLALLVTSSAHERVAVSDPGYMLYARSIQALERQPLVLERAPGAHEYAALLAEPERLRGAKALIVNSPENPSGYVASSEDWQAIAAAAARHGCWIIHDEVYDVMDFSRRHQPARSINGLGRQSILINSCSKKFGLPGLRIGWMVAPAPVIDQAAKAHDYFYLGINIQYGRIARRLLSDARLADWLQQMAQQIHQRCHGALELLSPERGYTWPRQPLGAMFLFPEVSALYARMPAQWRHHDLPLGDAVARYLLEARQVAVVPGSVYGRQGEQHVRLVLCGAQAVFERAMARLRAAVLA
jgi:phosphonopyruvate decarboxylase